MRRMGRVDGGKLKINENGEMYIERRGRKPGQKVKINKTTITPVTTPTEKKPINKEFKKKEPSVGCLAAIGISKKYASRRSLLFKSNCPSRSPYARTALHAKEEVWYKSLLYRVGDIVAIYDSDDRLPYFAQIRGIITDPLLEHFLSLTWLVPSVSAPSSHEFSPEHFLHAIVDKKNYEIKYCHWIQERPSTAAYQRPWTSKEIARKKVEEEVRQRAKNLWKVVDKEYKTSHGIPLVELTSVKNEALDEAMG